jgi:hypothetical protein
MLMMIAARRAVMESPGWGVDEGGELEEEEEGLEHALGGLLPGRAGMGDELIPVDRVVAHVDMVRAPPAHHVALRMYETKVAAYLWAATSIVSPSRDLSCLCSLHQDAFYAQVERCRDPSLRDVPLGIVQYNPYGSLETVKPEDDRRVNESNGSLIAVSYEARRKGVKRVMRGDEARAACPDLQLVQVPTAHGKVREGNFIS